MIERSHTVAVLAMSVDGKIADVGRSPARFGSAQDRAHLERQITAVDGLLFGAGTLRAYGSSCVIRDPTCLEARQQAGKLSQPTHLLCSASGRVEPAWRFFQQPISRWLLITQASRLALPTEQKSLFEQILTLPEVNRTGKSTVIQGDRPLVDWEKALSQLWHLGFKKLAILGGGQLMAALAAYDLIDEFWLTLCPLMLGGGAAPTPIDGPGLGLPQGLPLQLISWECIGQEVFLHYRRQR